MGFSVDNDRTSPANPGAFPVSPRFQATFQHLPTPATHERPPQYEPFVLKIWFVTGISVLTILLGIMLEVALYISETQNGFAVPAKNVFSFVSTQFLTSFFPTLLVVPLAYFWEISDWMLRWYQPYVTLSEGSAPASRSVLLDYIALNRLAVLYRSLTHRHILIVVSALIALTATLLQPLAGSLLQVRQVPHMSDSSALVTSTVALSPTIDDLHAFFASAGFALASVYDNLADPPFIREEWTAKEFQAPPNSYLNGTLAVNVTAIQSNVNCASPSSLDVTNTNGSYTATATFSGGCSASNVFNPANGTEQFSVTNASSCASSGLDMAFQPVVFWFYLNASSPQVASVYCNPTLSMFIVGTSMDLSNGALGPCTILEPVEGTNNVTESLQNGHPYNGVVFNQSDDFFVSSRARAINFGIPDAIYRYAAQQPGGPLSVFQDQYGFLNATTSVYTQHLAVAAQANYFLPQNATIPAQLTSDIPRLFVEALPTHVLACVMIIIGIIGLVVHFFHNRARHRLWLTSPPGSIAAIVSLTSRSGFGELLQPYDDERQMADRLSGLEFRLDHQTGAIIAEESISAAEHAEGVALLGMKRPYRGPSFLVDDSPDIALKD